MSDYNNLINRTGQRQDSFRMMIEHIKGLENPLIVETGCVRSVDDFSAGYSTVIFDQYVEECGGEFHSVDNNETNVNLARGLCKSSKTKIHVSDSVAFLENFYTISNRKIDLLYLDSYDYFAGIEHESSTHHHRELMAALPYLRPGTMIAVDDNVSTTKGKGAYILEYMNSQNKPRVYDGYQWIWIY